MDDIGKNYIKNTVKLFVKGKCKIKILIENNNIFTDNPVFVFYNALHYINSFKDFEESPKVAKQKELSDKINHMIITTNSIDLDSLCFDYNNEPYEFNTKIEINNRLKLLVEYFGIYYLRSINIKIISSNEFEDLSYDDSISYYTDCIDIVKYHLLQCINYC